MMRQIVYISSTRRNVQVDPTAILAISRRNNSRAQVTGLLFFNGKRFLQVLEGEDAVVDATFARIQQDDRHYALVVLSDREIQRREFGEWAMAYGAPGEDNADVLNRVVRLVADADAAVRATFEGFVNMRRAA